MRNITVCIPDETYRQARICAARRGLSVSALVRKFFHSLLELPSTPYAYNPLYAEPADAPPPPFSGKTVRL